MNKQTAPSKRAKGFRIGKNKPGTSSQSIYLGKAEKIKKTLIHKAKLKKQRAKELAKAGYSTTGQPDTDHERIPAEPVSDGEEHVDLIRRRRSTRTSDPTAPTHGASSSIKRKTHQDRNKSSDSLHNSINQATSTTSLPMNQPKPSAKVHHIHRNDHHAHPSSSSSRFKGKTTENNHHHHHHHHSPHQASNNTPKPHTNKTSSANSQHVNGQPKMNHRISKLLSKLEKEKVAH